MVLQKTLVFFLLYSHRSSVANALDDFMHGFKFKDNVHPFKQTLSGNTITTPDGREYSLTGNLVPETQLFSSKYFVASDDGSQVLDLRTGETIDIRISRAKYDDGTTIQVIKDEKGDVAYAEVHRKSLGGTPEPVTVLVKDEEGYQTFEETDVEFGTSYQTDAIMPPDSPDVRHQRRRTAEAQNPSIASRSLFTYTAGDGTSSDCNGLFRVVDVAIVFDSKFCSLMGGPNGAVFHIQAVFSGASLYYENDMCVRLALTDIRGTCDSNQDDFQYMNTDNPCSPTAQGQPKPFLNQFSKWQRDNREVLGLDDDASVHMFTGADIKSAAVGCAYIGTQCSKDWGASVNYMQFGNILAQRVIFAHEQGHVLGLHHLKGFSGNFIMMPHVTDGQGGFHPSSIAGVMNTLDRIQCDSFSGPTLGAVHQPTLGDGQQEAKSEALSGCSLSQPSQAQQKCGQASSQGKYACFPKDDFAEASSCSTSAPSITLDAWSQTSEEKPPSRSLSSGRHYLRGLKTLKNFESETCDKVEETSDYLCFLAENTDGEFSVYSVDYYATVDDISAKYSTEIVIENDGECTKAESKCSAI